MSREIAHKVIFPNKIIISQIFKISGILVILCPIATRAYICKRLRSPDCTLSVNKITVKYILNIIVAEAELGKVRALP
jgi:hypothetical protein